MISDESIEAAVDWLRDHAKEAAQRRADRIYLEEYSKVFKSMLMKEMVAKANQPMPVAVQEREALADERYLSHLKGLHEAVRLDAEATFLRQAAEAKINAWQTMSANVRAVKL